MDPLSIYLNSIWRNAQSAVGHPRDIPSAAENDAFARRMRMDPALIFSPGSGKWLPRLNVDYGKILNCGTNS